LIECHLSIAIISIILPLVKYLLETIKLFQLVADNIIERNDNLTGDTKMFLTLISGKLTISSDRPASAVMTTLDDFLTCRLGADGLCCKVTAMTAESVADIFFS